MWNEPKWCIKGISLPEKKLSTCETVDFWLKVGAGVGAFTAVLLVALTCYFWKKNQKYRKTLTGKIFTKSMIVMAFEEGGRRKHWGWEQRGLNFVYNVLFLLF